MRHFILFIVGLVAGLILILNVGPLIVLGISIVLLYLVYKQFVKATSTFSKVAWIIIGLIVLSVGISNIFAVIGIGAAFVLYWIYKNWRNQNIKETPITETNTHDPFMNFEREWQDLSK